jgi:hypothetical protein
LKSARVTEIGPGPASESIRGRKVPSPTREHRHQIVVLVGRDDVDLPVPVKVARHERPAGYDPVANVRRSWNVNRRDRQIDTTLAFPFATAIDVLP